MLRSHSRLRNRRDVCSRPFHVHIFADNATGWGEIGSVWNFTASDDVQLNFTTNTDLQKRSVFPRCEGIICAAQQNEQPVEPTDSFVQHADGSWYVACH